MTFEVRVRSVDQESPYAYPSRRVEIATSSGKVTTPDRAATLYEYNKKASVPTNVPLDNNVSLAVKRPNAATLAKFLEENGVARRWAGEMRGAARRMAYSALSAYLVQPTTADVPAKKKDGKEVAPAVISGASYLRSSPEKMESFLRILLRLQVDAGLGVVAVPSSGCPCRSTRRRSGKSARPPPASAPSPWLPLTSSTRREAASSRRPCRF